MYVLQFKKPYLELGPNFNQVLILYPPQCGSAFSCVLGAFSAPVGMLLDCWDMFVMFSITCCWTGEAKPALASSHAVRVMGPEVSDTRSQSTRPAETSSLQSVGQGEGDCSPSLSVILSALWFSLSVENLPLFMSEDQFPATVTETHCTNSSPNQLL